MRYRLIRAGAERLADELIRLADWDEVLRRRLEILAREGDPEELAGELTRQIADLRGRDQFISYGESSVFANELRGLVEAIRERVLPAQPGRAFELADALLLADGSVCERVDDSGGSVGDVYRDVCLLWLDAAARSRGDEDWMAKIRERAAEDGYGVRGALLPNAERLLTEGELRGLARHYGECAARALPDPATGITMEVRGCWFDVAQVAKALRDPDLYESAKRSAGRPVDDGLRVEVARLCIEWGQIDEALARLEEASGSDGYGRDSLLLECYERRGDAPRQVEHLWKLFEAAPGHDTYSRLLDLTPESGRSAARMRARDAALRYRHPATVVEFLLRAGWDEEAERVATGRPDGFDRVHYGTLVEVAGLAASSKRPLIEVVCYRSLLRDILDDGRSKAYGHAARYYRCLAQIDRDLSGYGLLRDHAVFVEGIRAAHGRKRAFWTRVEAEESTVG